MKTNKIFRCIHFFHAFFIMINIVTGIMMIKGISSLSIHLISGLLIFSIPLLLTVLTIKGKLIYYIFLRPVQANKVPLGIKYLKISATFLLAFVSLSLITGLLMLLGFGGITFKIHITSFTILVLLLPIHIILALLK